MLRIQTSVLASGLIALLLAACAKPLEVASITEIQPKNGAKGIDIYEPRRRSGDTLALEFAGDQLLEVRTYAQRDGQGEVEICDATLRRFRRRILSHGADAGQGACADLSRSVQPAGGPM